jgi:prophage antirepressor-like protein
MNIFKDLDKNRIQYNDKTIYIIIDNNDIVWFSAKEVTLALGYKDTKSAFQNAIRKNIPKKENRKLLHEINADNKQGHHNTLYINESGLYRLMLRSRLKKAEKFSDWVTEEVLPAIRKYGSYKLLEEHKKELHDIFNKINFLENENKKLRKDQCKPNFPEGGVVYVIDYSDEHQEIYRIGMTGSMKTRKQLYDTHTLHNHEVVHIVETKYPIQLETCVHSLLFKHRYFSNKKDFYECSLTTIKTALTQCSKGITITNRKHKQNGGSKTNKKRSKNMIEKMIDKSYTEKKRLQKRIDKLKEKLN